MTDRKSIQERVRKRAATRAAALQRRTNRLTVGGWTLYAFDIYNYAVEPVGDQAEARRTYWPDYKSALTALYHHLWAERCEQARNIADVLSAVQETEQRLLVDLNKAREP